MPGLNDVIYTESVDKIFTVSLDSIERFSCQKAIQNGVAWAYDCFLVGYKDGGRTVNTTTSKLALGLRAHAMPHAPDGGRGAGTLDGQSRPSPIIAPLKSPLSSQQAVARGPKTVVLLQRAMRVRRRAPAPSNR